MKHRTRLRWSFLAALVIPWSTAAAAQVPDSLLSGGVAIANFAQATDLAIDPDGILYIADAARGAVLRMDRTGVLLGQFGTRGAGDAQFDRPAALDPTNGLIVLVADAGNARIQRWSRDGQFLESLPVPVGDRTGRGLTTSYLPGSAAVDARADGQPTAVVSTPDDRIFAIESVSSTIVIWDRNRRLQRVLSEPELRRPIALAANERFVFVADESMGRIEVLDRFGTRIRSLGSGVAAGIRNVTLTPDRVWAVLPSSILEFETGGRLIRRYLPDGVALMIDAGFAGDETFILTEKTLYRFDAP